MKTLTIAALCAGLAAAPLVAKAADLVLYDAAGEPVAVLVADPAPIAMPAFPARLFAEQDAIMDRMMRTMDAAFHAGPAAFVPATLGTLQPGSTVVVTSVSDGRRACSRTVTYEQRGSGAPVVKVAQTGDACGALPMPARPETLPAAAPDTASPALPEMLPGNTKLIRVDYRHPVAKPVARHG